MWEEAVSSSVPQSASSDMDGVTHCIPKQPLARQAHDASAQTIFRQGSRHTCGGTKHTCGRGCCGETDGDTIRGKKLRVAGRLHHLEVPCQSRGAVRSKDQWKKMS